MGSFLSLFFKGHERSVRAKKNILALGAFKSISLLSNFLLVPLLLGYLDTERFGIWIILNSLVSWILILDFGLANGLRNKLSEARAKNHIEEGRAYLSTTYFIILVMVLILLFLFFVINPFLNWTSILNASPEMESELHLLALIVFVFFMLKFFFGIISTVLTADHKPSYSSAIDTLSGLISLVIIFFLARDSEGSLINVGIVIGFATAIVPIAASIYFYNTRYKNIAPSYKFIDFPLIRKLANLSLKFFILQLGSLFIYSVSNLIITQLFGPEEVTSYNIAFRYYSILLFGFTILLTPFWSAYTEAYIKNDYEWIRNSIKKLNKIWLLSLVLIVLMTVFANVFYKIWVGDGIKIPLTLSILMGIYIMVSTWSNIYVNFINGTGKITLQVIGSISVIVFMIPLSLLFVKFFNMGVEGILLAIIVCILPWGILWPFQVNKILSGRSKGIWVK